MRRALVWAPLAALLALAAWLPGQEPARGKYRKPASGEKLRGWQRDHAAKKAVVPPPPAPPASEAAAVDFTGVFRFGPYDYDLVIEQRGDQVTFRSGGVDHQDIGGAFETIGAGYVENGRIHARWWCFDLSRNYANNGGCEMWFTDPQRNRLYTRYYHDADEKIEEGYGVRLGTYDNERLHYRIRIRHPVAKHPEGLWLSGTVRGRGGEAIEDAVVMLRHEESTAVRTDRDGRWRLRVTALPTVQMVSAAAPGYRTAVDAILKHEVRALDFVLDASPFADDPRYEFVSPAPDRKLEIFRCGNCHRNSYEEWKESRHAIAAQNPVTRAVYERAYLPDLAAGRAEGDPGLCAACHAPEAALDGAVARLDRLAGTALLGNHCDFCHKVHHTEEIEAAGVRGSLALGRPSPDDPAVPGPIKRVYGVLADSDYLMMGPVYNPFFATSVLCAGCHQHTTEQGVPALDTYGEWRAWAAAADDARTCQSCHMPTGTSMEGKKLARRVCVNALRRPPEQIHDHSFQGRELAPGAVALDVSHALLDGRLVVTTKVRAGDVGHRVPTGTGDKHLLLVVLAGDEAGRPYPLAEGPRVPAHAGGAGDPLRLDATALRERLEAGDLAGLPGREFAQVLADAAGERYVPFWRAVRVVEDTRLEPGREAAVRHAFAVPAAGAVRLRVELLHRARFKRGDVAADAAGEGVRPRDLLIATQILQVRDGFGLWAVGLEPRSRDPEPRAQSSKPAAYTLPMTRTGWAALLLAALAAAQGGRDTGEGENAVAFLRWKPTAESGAIYNTTWKALEPHFGVLSRLRLFDFDGDPKRAEELAGREAALVVAFDAGSAGRWPDRGVPVLRAYGMETDRARFARWLKLFLPGASRVAVFGKTGGLPGYTLASCTTAAAAEGCDAAWIPEGSAFDARALRRQLDAMGIPLVTTSPDVAEGLAALTVRPDPTSLGLDLAAVVLGHVRAGKPLRAPTATRLRVTVDLRASRAAGHEAPLEALARADVVRREP